VSVIDLRSAKHAKEQMKELRLLDAKASYVALDQCLKTLKINSLPELDKVKKEIIKTMKELEKIENA
jgi:hypothetical protein